MPELNAALNNSSIKRQMNATAVSAGDIGWILGALYIKYVGAATAAEKSDASGALGHAYEDSGDLPHIRVVVV
jgi:hypothetical protein